MGSVSIPPQHVPKYAHTHTHTHTHKQTHTNTDEELGTGFLSRMHTHMDIRQYRGGTVAHVTCHT